MKIKFSLQFFKPLLAISLFFFLACDTGSSSPESKGDYAELPTNQNLDKIQEMYNTWINTYYVTYEEDSAAGTFNPQLTNPDARGTARIKSRYGSCSTKGECTASEAIGYGMILTSLMEDFEKFDKLLKYSKAFRYDGTALMRWDIADFRSGSGGSATDADIDIAAALFIAYTKTEDQKYLDDAIEIGRSIYDEEVHESSKLILPARKGETWSGGVRIGDGNLYNISYMSLPAIKMLALYDNSRDWNAVLNANIIYMEKVQNSGNLWPDWSDADGAPINPNNGSNSVLTASAASGGGTVNSYAAYYKETPRIPWRIAWYYHWFGDNKAKVMLDKGMDFLKNRGIEDSRDIKDFYSYSDDKESGSAASVIRWVSLCALGVASSANQEWLNACNDRIFNANFTSDVGDYYRNSLHLIYAMLLNGKF